MGVKSVSYPPITSPSFDQGYTLMPLHGLLSHTFLLPRTTSLRYSCINLRSVEHFLSYSGETPVSEFERFTSSADYDPRDHQLSWWLILFVSNFSFWSSKPIRFLWLELLPPFKHGDQSLLNSKLNNIECHRLPHMSILRLTCWDLGNITLQEVLKHHCSTDDASPLIISFNSLHASQQILGFFELIARSSASCGALALITFVRIPLIYHMHSRPWPWPGFLNRVNHTILQTPNCLHPPPPEDMDIITSSTWPTQLRR